MRILTGILLLFLAVSQPVFPQPKTVIDSFSQILSQEREYELRQELSTSKEDSNRVLILHDLYYTVLFSEPDSAMYLAQEGLKLSLQLNYKKGEALCKTDIGSVWWIVGDYSKANEVMLEGLKIAESINDPRAIEWSLSFLLSINRDQGNTTEALKYAVKGWATHEFFSEKLWNVILASVYQEMNNTDSALFYLQRGDSGDYNFLLFGHVYTKMGEHDLARFYYKKAVPGLTKHNNLKDLADAYIGLARLYEIEGKPDSAIYYASKGFAIAQTASFKKWVYETSLILSRIYEKKDVYQSLRYFKLAMAAKDSMFNLQKVTESLSNRYNQQLYQKETEAARVNYQSKVRTYLLLAAVAFFLIIATILYRSSRHKQKAKEKIEKAYVDLKTAQSQLIQSEKMASLGELTAGIAHEIQNPLNFVNNFSEVNKELIDEMEQEMDKGNLNDAKAIAKDIRDNEEKITHHGKRADAIVKGMLQHSRSSAGVKEPTDINALAEEYLRLAYHGLRAKDKSFNAKFETDFDNSVGKISIIPQDIGRVILNLLTNAFYTVSEKKQKHPDGFEPTVSIATQKINGTVEIRIADNGNGIPQNIVDKIFQPFFTTKPTGQGTGLGLSLAYDIVKAYGGELKVETKEGEGSEFVIQLSVT